MHLSRVSYVIGHRLQVIIAGYIMYNVTANWIESKDLTAKCFQASNRTAGLICTLHLPSADLDFDAEAFKRLPLYLSAAFICAYEVMSFLQDFRNDIFDGLISKKVLDVLIFVASAVSIVALIFALLIPTGSALTYFGSNIYQGTDPFDIRLGNATLYEKLILNCRIPSAFKNDILCKLEFLDWFSTSLLIGTLVLIGCIFFTVIPFNRAVND